MNARLILSGILFSFLALGWVGACVMLRAAEVGELVMPLEDRKFDALEVVTVGTGGPYENPERLGPVTAIGWDTHVLLVDAGRGTAEALRRSKIPVSQPRTILLTNLLPYNTMGLDDLLFTGWLVGREQGIQLIGPPGTRKFAKNLLAAHRAGSDAHGSSLNLPSEAIQLDVIEVGDGWSEERDGLKIRAGELRGGPTPGLAWRFERDGKSVLVAGTGWDSDTLVSLASGVDILVHEAVYVPPPEDIEDAGVIADPDRLRREAALHTSILDIGELASRARVGTLLLVRMRPPPFFALQVRMIVDDHFDGNIEVPNDGESFSP